MEENIPENQTNQADLSQTPVTMEKKKVNPLTIVILLIVILLVGVGGVYAGMQIVKKQTPIPLVSQPTLVPTSFVQPTTTVTSIPSSDPTANWKTYTNTKYGFEFKYPNFGAWMEKENPTQSYVGIYNYNIDTAPGRSYSPSDGDLFKIEVYVDENNHDVNTWFDAEKRKADPGTDKVREFSNIKQIVVAGQKGIYFEDNMLGLMGGSAVFQRPFEKGLIHFYGELNFTGNKKYFDQILSTFKFTD